MDLFSISILIYKFHLISEWKIFEIHVNFCLSAYNSIDANWCAFYLQQYKYVAKKHCSSSILPEIFEDPS